MSALRINEAVLITVDAIVMVCGFIMDADDPRPWQERLKDCFAEIDLEEIAAGIVAFASENDGQKLEAWVEDVQRVGYRAYARRLLGAAEYTRLERALKEDAAIVALAVRRAMRALMPFAVAWEDAVNVMTREQLKAVTTTDLLGLSIVKMVVDLDALLGEKMLPALPMEITSATAEDLVAWRPEDAELLAKQFREIVSGISARRVEQANFPLVRKIKGARDALEHSADGISQAANSLIELIDRLMREAYDRSTVVDWVDSNFSDDTGLIYVESGERRPTKRAEALCLVYGSGRVARPPTDADDGTGPSLIHDVLARVIVVARTRLQQLKHADLDQESERERLLMVMSALEGALMIGLQVGLLATANTSGPDPGEQFESTQPTQIA
jgi:hypothetical protein